VRGNLGPRVDGMRCIVAEVCTNKREVDRQGKCVLGRKGRYDKCTLQQTAIRSVSVRFYRREQCSTRLDRRDEVGIEVQDPLGGSKCSGGIAESLQGRQQRLRICLACKWLRAAHVHWIMLGRMGKTSEVDVGAAGDGAGDVQDGSD
jgi:hypothetical protein